MREILHTDSFAKWGPPVRTGLITLCTFLLVWLVVTVHEVKVRYAETEEQIIALRRDMERYVGIHLSALEARVNRLENMALTPKAGQ